MGLADVLESQFRADVRFRGAAYLQADRVSITHITPNDVYAVVRDGEEHQTHLHRVDGDLELYCSSVTGTKRPATTKYVWATILAVDAEGHLTGTPKAGSIPPFIVQADEPMVTYLEEDEIEDDFLFPPITLPTQTKTATKKKKTETASEKKKQIPAWKKKFREIQDRLTSKHVLAEYNDVIQEIHYLIDIKESWTCGQLVLQINERQKRANGRWGKMRPLKIRSANLDSILDSDDRDIIARLLGATAEKSGNGSATTGTNNQLASRFRLNYPLCEFLLPKMSQTGHLSFLSHDEQILPPLSWCDESAWHLTLKMEPSAGADASAWSLSPCLERDGQIRDIGDFPLMIEGGLVFTESTIEPLDDYESFDWIEFLKTAEVPDFLEEEGNRLSKP